MYLQEELKIAYLINAVEEEQEMNTREQELKSKLEGMIAHKVRRREHEEWFYKHNLHFSHLIEGAFVQHLL